MNNILNFGIDARKVEEDLHAQKVMRGSDAALIYLCKACIVTPFPFIYRTAGIVKGSASMPLALNKIPCVLIAQETLQSAPLVQDPDVCAPSMLTENRDQVIHSKS